MGDAEAARELCSSASLFRFYSIQTNTRNHMSVSLVHKLRYSFFTLFRGKPASKNMVLKEITPNIKL